MNRVIKHSFIIIICLVTCIAFVFHNNSEVSYAASKKPSKVVITSVKSADYNAIKVTWKKAKNAKKYQVYRATSKNGSYKLVKTTTATYFSNTKLTTGKKYYYKVRGVNGTKKGSFSTKKYAVPTLKQVTNVKATATENSIKLTWNKVNGATGYQIYRSKSETDTFTKVGTTSNLYYTNKNLSSQIGYYYKVRAYKKVGSSYKYGKYSSVKYTETLNSSLENLAYLNYSKTDSGTKTKIYIDQPWSDSLNDNLNGGSKVNKLLTRGNYDLYCYDVDKTDDFDNFLIVYVNNSANKVAGWVTTANNLGVFKGTSLVQGNQASGYADYDKWGDSTGLAPYVPMAKINAGGIDKGDIYFGGILKNAEVGSGCSSDLEAEELLCEYTVNALRVMSGKSILQHNIYIYGDGETYGMKAWANTMATCKEVTHGVLNSGVLAGKDINERCSDITRAAYGELTPGGENVTGGTVYGGERAADMWYRSSGHNANLLANVDRSGYYPTSEMASALALSNDGKVYWSWNSGEIKIDYGVYAPKVTVSDVTGTTAKISWTDTLAEVEGTSEKYTLEISKVNDFSSVVMRGSTSKVSYTRTGLELGTKYYARVKAQSTIDGSARPSEWSEVVEFTTLAE